MKLSWLLLFLLPVSAFCQNGLVFNTKYYRAEDKWVIFPKKETDDTYLFGFIYLDEQAGFTLEYGGSLKIDNSGKYTQLDKDTLKTSIKMRLTSNTANVAIIKDDKLVELGLPKEPEWLISYKKTDDKVSSLIARGFHYNHVGASDIAIPMLEEAYEDKPQAKGLAFELAYAYNATGDFKSAEPVLIQALEKDSKNALLYKELVFAYIHQQKFAEAETVYNTSAALISDNDFKAEMAFNIAQGYYQKKDKKNFTPWAKTAKKYCSKENKVIVQYLDAMAKQL